MEKLLVIDRSLIEAACCEQDEKKKFMIFYFNNYDTYLLNFYNLECFIV